ncbi:MAG: hypothetical protein E7427_00860 [Ruminococcaceae bacterium]|nr:hypothetical protein [Oscillospiraceae bacterium]
MKRLSSLLLLCALLSALAAPALADVAYIPTNDFLEKHQQDCVYENRWYWTNGPFGYVQAHTAPESRESVPLPNGQRYLISSIYQGSWGLLEYDPDTLGSMPWQGVSAWVRMSDMVADYDNQSFMADHGAELVQETAELDWNRTDTVYVYRYPGSGVVTDSLSPEWFGQDQISFGPLFTDPAGRRWGYCGYLYGHRDLWVCLDDPYNGALAPDENCVTIVTRAAADPPAQTEAPAPTEVPTLPPAVTPAPTVTPDATQAPEPAEAPLPAPASEPTSAPTESPSPGKTIELTPAADDKTLEQAAREGRGSKPYIAAGAAAVVVVAAAVLIAALRKKRK